MDNSQTPHDTTALAVLFRSGGWENSILGQVTPEIILEITSHLPITSAACFALTCHSLCSILGTAYWEELGLVSKYENENRAELLSLLERDMPDHINCYFCEQLHTADEIRQNPPWITRPRAFHWRQDRPCCHVILNAFSAIFLHRHFNFTTFQMAMKRHRLGLDCSTHLKLLEFPREGIRNLWDFEGPTSAQVRIVSGSMMMRKEKQVSILDCLKEAPCPDSKDLADICSHQMLCQFSPTTGISYTKGHYLLTSTREVPRGLTRCPYCPTEFQVEAKYISGKGITAVVTIWLDLGEGRSSLDPDFQERLLGLATLPDDDRYRTPRVIPSVTGSIRARFEQGSPLVSNE
jgi:hypothetical protein